MDRSTLLTPRLRSGLLWTAMVLGGLIALVLVTLLLIDWNAFKGPIERLASDRSGRVVRIEGPLEVDVWSWTPTVALGGLVVGNPPWESGKQPFVRIERLNASLKLLPLLKGDVILPRVELVRPDVYLHRDRGGRANWTFESTRPTNAPAGEPPDLPVVRDFLIQEGKLTVHDELLRLEMHGLIQAREQSSKDDPEAFRISGDGTLNQKPFTLRVVGGPLVNLQPDHPYPFDMTLKAGDIDIHSDGRVLKPFDLGKLSVNLRAKGGDLADLYYLTHLAFPNTPPFDLAAHVDRNGSNIHIKGIAGQIGKSDMRGELSIDASRKRSFVKGHLVAERLRLRDLAASFGAKSKSTGTLEGEAEAPKPSKRGAEETPPQNARLFPATHLQVDRVRAMDADVKFTAESIEAGRLPLKEVSFRIRLNEGVLTLDPLQMELPQGKLHGTVHLDARKNTPFTRLDLRMTDIQLDQLKGKAPDATPPLTGVLQARAHLAGSGDSMHHFMSDSQGRVSLILPEGEVREAFAELTGINVARGLGLLVSGSDDRAPIRCGVAQFNVENGVMTADNVVFDTENVRITGKGEVRLGPEELDLSIKGQPKKFRLLRLRSPVKIGGHLRKPSIGVDAGKTLKQGAIASALAALTPVAAIIAFVDPGLAKDENCAALLASSPKPGAGRERLDGQ